MSANSAYDEAAAELRRPPATTGRNDRDLVRMASLAASSHNTQPWTFTITPDSIVIRPDLSRRCPVVDPDDAHLYKSLGCATENLVQAARAQGITPEVAVDPANGTVTVTLDQRGDREPNPLSSPVNAPAPATTAHPSTATNSRSWKPLGYSVGHAVRSSPNPT